MCVIAVVEKSRPSFNMVSQMWHQNDHGAGIAWREEGLVKWRKGLNLEEMHNLCATLPLPYIAHFRIASVGGRRASLTHPFAIEDHDLALKLDGQTKGGVLFHNGTWSDWKKLSLESAARFAVKVPQGHWSDSRAMAWLCKLYSPGILDFLDEKTVVFTPTEVKITPGSGFVKVDDIWCSNDYFVQRSVQTTQGSATAKDGYHNGTWYGRTMCKYRACTVKDNLDKDGNCPKHVETKGNVLPMVPNGGGSLTPKALPPAGGTTKATVMGPTGGGRAVSPFELRRQLEAAELEWDLIERKILKRSDAEFSKSRLKSLRKQVAKLNRKALKAKAGHATHGMTGQMKH